MVHLEKAKIYRDVIHNSIYTTRLANAIIDNEIYQRLRYLRQLGLSFLVYSNANNTRFEHSLGTYHMAGLLLNSLIINSDIKEINKSLIQIKYIKNYLLKKLDLEDNEKSIEQIINNKSLLLDNYLIELIKIAGLCHDLGHGPFSHMFDEWLHTKDELIDNKLIEHENRSIILLKLIIENGEFTHKKIKYKISTFIDNEAYEFISSLINPSSYDYIIKKHFIYQIISNSLNDLDVDKLDYICRDSYYLCSGEPINISRIIEHAKVIENNIVFPEKASYEIFKVYRSRYDLHKMYYNNKTVVCIEQMIKTVFDKLDKILKISENIKLLNIENFISLTDTVILNTASIIEQIKPSNYEEIKDDIKEINTIIKNITNRKIYKCLYQSSYKTTSKINTEQLINKIIEKNKKINIELKKEKIIPLIKKIGLISGNKPHPFNNLYFYGKNYDSKVLSKNKMSQLISPFFQENILFLINSSLEE